MSQSRPHIPYTYEDYKSLPESMDRRYELLGGELYMVPAPTTRHQRISQRIEFLLLMYLRTHDLGEVLDAPVDVVFGQGHEREVAQPDIVFVRRERAQIVIETEIDGAPDLVIEILSPGTEVRDRTYKKTLYARYGVHEYWIVDPVANTVEIYVLDARGYGSPRIYTATDELQTSLFPDLQIPLAEIFRT
jgi:Uma2 family endonuclease